MPLQFGPLVRNFNANSSQLVIEQMVTRYAIFGNKHLTTGV